MDWKDFVPHETLAPENRDVRLAGAPAAFFFGGILAVLLGGVMYLVTMDLRWHGIKTEGVIVSDARVEPKIEGTWYEIFYPPKAGYQPVIRYADAAGKTYTIDAFETEASPRNVGDKLEVLYLPDNPLVSAIVGRESDGRWAIGLILLGAGMTAAASRFLRSRPEEDISPATVIDALKRDKDEPS